MNLLQAIVLGIVQGFTEFLPVSSSGHLVLFQFFFGISTDTNVIFDVMVHIGTLISVVIVFYKDIAHLVKEFFLMLIDLFKGRGFSIKGNPYRNMLTMIIIGTIPTGVMGIVFNDIFERLFTSVRIVSLTLLITGILLFIIDKLDKGYKKAQDIKVNDALIVGLFQGFAITPGISRSGSTIFAGLLRGFDRDIATRFSFIMSIPAIAGAAFLEGKDYLINPTAGDGLGLMFIGMLTAAISGTFAIKFLVKLLIKGKLHYFSYYCWALGILAFTISFVI